MHAIVIHDGGAETGHYYAYIYDRKLKKWYKFNDHNVSEEIEEVVFYDAYGDIMSHKTAYCILYINEKIASLLNNVSIFDLCTGKDLKVDPGLKKVVQDGNLKFTTELTKYQVDKIVKKIVDKQAHRIKQVENYIENQVGLV